MKFIELHVDICKGYLIGLRFPLPLVFESIQSGEFTLQSLSFDILVDDEAEAHFPVASGLFSRFADAYLILVTLGRAFRSSRGSQRPNGLFGLSEGHVSRLASCPPSMLDEVKPVSDILVSLFALLFFLGCLGRESIWLHFLSGVETKGSLR